MGKKKVFVGLSGGVDSSVSAALLKESGYEVTGVFIRVWQPPFLICNWKEDRLDAMRVCARLNIPFRELNLEKEYKTEVVDYMLREYRAGRTPNPDVACNRSIKFGAFYDWARKEGADFVATGHYARVGTREFPIINSQFSNNDSFLNFQLWSGIDQNKDQSYFLWQIRREQLPHILFPVGGMEKTEVRKLAKKFELPTAEKKDSQGLCFVGKVDMKEFLSHYIKPKKGKVVDVGGAVVGEHDGANFYTIGERIGGGFVVAKDMQKNTLTVAEKNVAGELPQATREAILTDCNWLVSPEADKTYFSRTRYRAPLYPCWLAFIHDREQMLDRVAVRFEKPHTLAPGQSLVVYDGDIVVGGGILGG